MSSPTEPFSQLSLGRGSMPPTTRSQTRPHMEPEVGAQESDHHCDSDSEDGSDSEPVFSFEETTGVARFPSYLQYALNTLDDGTRRAIVDSMSSPDPSKLVLRQCQCRDQDIIFNVSESVERTCQRPHLVVFTYPYSLELTSPRLLTPIPDTIRIQGTASGNPVPSCTCQHLGPGGRPQYPCRHTLRLCDLLVSQTRPVQEQALTVRPDGYPTELDSVCRSLAPEFHFDVLADSLQCDKAVPGQQGRRTPGRVQTAREILRVLSNDSDEQEEAEEDSEAENEEQGVIVHKDLKETIFRMLLDNHEFFSYFLSEMREFDTLNGRFRGFRDRADAALDGLDEYAKYWSNAGGKLSPFDLSPSRPDPRSKGVEWCARHLRTVAAHINSLIHCGHLRPKLNASDKSAAASTLVHMLKEVVGRNQDVGPSRLPRSERNLYEALVGSSTARVGRNRFVLDVLEKIPGGYYCHLEADLTDIEEWVGRYGAPAPFAARLEELKNRAKDGGNYSKKRPSDQRDQGSKRVKQSSR
ncbi:hypothetical protein F4780DRAFT_213121 [Xylariomycetidae sp. FL0641]|nr:hypothetical protein F4780DRAFT_213121 [Xylariomycetidae sp. FL0641]